MRIDERTYLGEIISATNGGRSIALGLCAREGNDQNQSVASSLLPIDEKACLAVQLDTRKRVPKLLVRQSC